MRPNASDAPPGGAAALVRRRLSTLTAATGLFTLVDASFSVIGPLWAKRELGLDHAGWAFLRATGELGGLLGVLGFALLVARAGVHRAGAGAALAGMAAGAPAGWCMPVLGAGLGCTFVTLNLLTQQIDPARSGRANAAYRAAACIVAPLLATAVSGATGSHGPVLAGGGVMVGGAAWLVLRFPASSPERSARPWGALLGGHWRCRSVRSLWVFIGLTRGFGAAVAAVGLFAALRFTGQLR